VTAAAAEPATRVTGSDGVAVAVYRWGEPGELPPVFLQHGFVADTLLNWHLTGVVPALLAAGREVVGVDARGHGRSDTPHDPARYGEARMAEDLRGVADALEVEQFDLAGYSMGAVISLLVAVSDRRVRRLVIGGVGSGVVECGGVDRRTMSQAALIEALEATDPATITDPGAAAFRRLADGVGADRQALAAQGRAVHQQPIALGEVTAPMLLLAGAADPLAERPQVLADAVPGARLQLVPGDHLGAVAAAEYATALVGFLGQR